MKKHLFAIVYSLGLIFFTIYILLDTFVNSKVYKVTDTNINNDISINHSLEKDSITITSDMYEDGNIEIKINEYTYENTQVYVADVQIKNPEFLKTAFANNTYGKNITAKTSSIAKSVNAIFAINGDYYGVQEKGYVLKNGVVYRDTTSGAKEDLVIYKDGEFDIINESEIDIYTLQKNGAYNILSFGPALIRDGIVSVSKNYEVAKAMKSNPRTAIGIIDNLHYVFVVSDGRTTVSEGLTVFELAEFMKNKLEVKTAYNLDGGGSSTMYFNGVVVNNPTTNGNRVSERNVSDIVYIGY